MQLRESPKSVHRDRRSYIVVSYTVTRYSYLVRKDTGSDIFNFLPLSPQVFHILVAVADSDQHGYGIMQDVESRTGGKLRLSAGTLYGSIKRILEQGWIVELRARDRPNMVDDRRRYYRLTSLGREVVKAEALRMAELLKQARTHGLAPKRA